MVNHLLNNQNILKDIFEDKKGQWQKWWRRERVEMRLEFFESLNGITDFLLWKWFGKLLRSKWLFSWMSVRWALRLPDSENDLEHTLQGRGRRVFLKMRFPQHMVRVPQHIVWFPQHIVRFPQHIVGKFRKVQFVNLHLNL